MDKTDKNLKVNEFITRLNSIPHAKTPDPMEVKRLASLFLYARKFDVDRAIDLYKSYRHMRYSQQLMDIDPFDEGVRRELLSEKFTVLPHTSPTGSRVVIFTVKHHWPPACTDRDVLKGILYQLDATMMDKQTQKQGITVIYDMADAKYSNFGADLTMKLLNLLTGSYPARVVNVLILAAPFWFRPPYHISRLFVKDKIRERIFSIDKTQLTAFLPLDAIPTTLGGRFAHQHADWLKSCFMKTMGANSPPPSYYTLGPLANALPNGHNNLIRRPSLTKTSWNSRQVHRTANSLHRKPPWISAPGSPSAKRFAANGSNSLYPSNNKNVPSTISRKSGLTDGNLATDSKSPTRLTLEQFLDQRTKLLASAEREFEMKFKNAPPAGPITQFTSNTNWSKNRYVDVPCLDASAVLLTKNAYIHANFVHGYNRPNAYILTQGPLESTILDFWQMVWITKATVIVMLTKTFENGRSKCSQYWPLLNGSKEPKTTIYPPNISVTNLSETLKSNGLFKVTELQISLLDSKGKPEPSSIRKVNHLLFLGWPDFDVPQSSDGFLTFLDAVNEVAGVDKMSIDPPSTPLPPIIIHCSAGIGRTGTFTAIDISLDQARIEGHVDIVGTVSRIRCQRTGAVQLAKQYAFIFLTLLTRLAKKSEEAR